MYFDLHIHTNKYSWCSNIPPKTLIKKAIKLKLDGIAITEHHAVWSREEVKGLKEETGAHNLIILRGQEITAYREDGSHHGDILVYGFEGKCPDKPTTKQVLDLVHEAGGVAISAHPYRWGYGHGDDVYHYDFDGIEVLNHYYHAMDIMKAERAARELNLTGTGSSDAHDADDIGIYLTRFEMPVRTEEELIEEIKAGRCKAVRYEDAGL